MSEWIRVTPKDKCPICEKDSWCTYNSEVAICMRIFEGGKQKTFKDGSVGAVHRLGSGTIASPVSARPQRKEEPTINAGKIMDSYWSGAELPDLAKDLGVSEESLRSLGCKWAAPFRAFAFPMMSGMGDTVGIRLRASDGRKWAVKGSRQGIFLPSHNGSRRAVICEGPTDTAAALTMGLWAIGRPHCSGGMEDIKTCFKRHSIREAVILSDNDEPGIRGAAMLRNQLKIPTALLILPTKDMRQFLNKGGTKEDIEALLSNVAWQQPSAA